MAAGPRRTRFVAFLVVLSIAAPGVYWWFEGHAEVERRVRELWGDPTERARFHSQRLSRFVAPTLVSGEEGARRKAEELVSGAPIPGRLVEGLPGVQSAARVPKSPSNVLQWSVSVDPQPFRDRLEDRLAVNHRQFNRTYATGMSLAALVGVLIVLVARASEREAAERTRFAALTAHELRTPLASLRLHADLLGEDLGDPDKMREYARRVSADADRLERVVENVMSFARSERGLLVARPVVADLVPAVHEIVERMRPTLSAAGATLEVDAAEPVPGVWFDRDALDLVLQNLLDNAERYGGEAADRTIRVSVRTDGRRAGIEVADRGPGVPRSLEKTLFLAFSRGSNRDGPPGLGLGLSQARALLRAQGGDLTYVPRPGGGSIFRVLLVCRPEGLSRAGEA